MPSATLYTLGNSASSFVPGPACGSPWSPAAQHGGPPCALLAHALEQEVAGEKLLPARLVVDLFRSVPMRELRVRTDVARRGRRLAVIDAELVAPRNEGQDEVVVARASALFLQGHHIDEAASTPWPLPAEGAQVEPMVPRAVVDRVPPGFHTTVEVERLADRPLTEGGPALWVRIPLDLLPGRPLSAFERCAASADFCNALRGRAGDANPLGLARDANAPAALINTDSSVHLARLPEGEWLGLRLLEAQRSASTGRARCEMFDASGPFGWVEQSSVSAARRQGGRRPSPPHSTRVVATNRHVRVRAPLPREFIRTSTP